jgi:hypothetical protein
MDNKMSEDYPLYPSLTEDGEKQAQAIMDSFKLRVADLMKTSAEEVMIDLYCDVAMHIESDSWTNYRNELMDGFKGYKAETHKHDFKELRQAIYSNHKEQIVKDLDQDLMEENARLKIELQKAYDFNRNH